MFLIFMLRGVSLIVQSTFRDGVSFRLAQHGVPILELVNLEGLAEDRVYEFAFIGGSLKLRGADAAPIRPIAIPVH